MDSRIRETFTRMADNENAVIALLDDLNARMHRQRQRARWLIDRLPDRELKKFAPLIEDMIRATNEAQEDLKALRAIEHERPRLSTRTAERQDAARRELERADEE